MKTFFFSYVITLVAFSAYILQDNELEESKKRGAEIYTDFCISCHLTDGAGVANTFPPLAKSDYLMENRNASIHGVKYGQQAEIVVNGVTYNSAMPSPGLEDNEIADVMNYILNSWGNSSDKIVTLEEVEAIKK